MARPRPSVQPVGQELASCPLLPWAMVLFVALLGISGCRRHEADDEGTVVVRRYNANMVEAKDVVDVYAEAVNASDRRSAPTRVRAVLSPGGEVLASAAVEIGRLEPKERRHVSLHLTGCTGRLRERDLSVFAEQTTEDH